MKFYTHVYKKGNNLLVKGYDNGKPFQEKIKYSPSLFLESDDSSKYKTIFNKPVKKKTFDTIYDAKEFLNQYKSTNVSVYGNDDFKYCYLSDNYKDIEFNSKWIHKVFLDLETTCGAKKRFGPNDKIKIRKKPK